MADIKETLRLHAMWIAGEEGGVRANLYGANLRGADLYGANLSGANLHWANLHWADLSRADLCGANLSGANLSGANLRRANLSGANLSEANLYGADLRSARGNGQQVKSLQIGKYDVVYTAEVMQIGCQCKSIAEWFGLDSIPGYESNDLQWLAFKPLIKRIIEQYPATPTGKESQNG